MSSAPHSKRSLRQGFTLLEVMVAVSLLAVLGILTYMGMVTTVKAQESIKTMMERHAAARMTLTRMRNEISMAFVSLHQAEDQRTQTIFDGQQDQLIFTTMAYEPFKKDNHESDQLEVEYRLERVDNSQDLVRRVKSHVDDRPGKGGYEETMVSGVKDLEFEYWDPEQEKWRDDWSVIIEDAVEMREKLKLLESARDDLKVDSGNTDLASAASETMRDAAVDLGVDELENEVMEDILLPSRVRIRIVLTDADDYDYPIETQVEVVMRRPLWY